MTHHNPYCGNQKGSVLVIVMLVLVAVMALSVTMINISNQEMKAAGNYKHSQTAFYNGDSGVYATPKFIRLLNYWPVPLAEETPNRIGCVQYLNTTTGNPGQEILDRIQATKGVTDATAAYNGDPTTEQDPNAADISMNGCDIDADINIVWLGFDRQGASGDGTEFGTASDGLGGGGGSVPMRYRLVSTGKDSQSNTHVIRGMYRFKKIPGGL